MNCQSVMRFGGGTEQDNYRDAVATIIRDIQRDTGLDLCVIADSIEVSTETILNAVNRRSNLNAMYLARFGLVYGVAYLNPYMALMGGQATPLDKNATRDILPLVTTVAHKVACARDPEGPGGATEVPQEKAAYLPALKQLHREVGTLIPQIEAALS